MGAGARAGFSIAPALSYTVFVGMTGSQPTPGGACSQPVIPIGSGTTRPPAQSISRSPVQARVPATDGGEPTTGRAATCQRACLPSTVASQPPCTAPGVVELTIDWPRLSTKRPPLRIIALCPLGGGS